MITIYTSFSCKQCRREFILLTEELNNATGYLVCPYCSNRYVKKEKVTNNLKECMQERSYRRRHGALIQK